MMKSFTYAWELYKSNLGLIALSAISLIIAFLIPVFASLPTYNDMGGIFVRTSSLYLNLNPINTAIIIASVIFSLLFISFASVVINVIAKHSRTKTSVKTAVLHSLEKYTGRVFAILLLYSILIFAVNVLFFWTNYSGIITSIVALLLIPIFFYAPSSVVIDEHNALRAMRASAKFFFKDIWNFVAWVIALIITLSVIDFIVIAISGSVLSSYIMLVISSIFILPFFLMLQGEMYISRFKLLK